MDKNEILKALANPARLEILNHLKDPKKHFPTQEHPLELGVCASQFERCGLSQSTVSAHLGTLHRAGLVTTKRLGQWIFYKRNEETIAQFLAAMQKEL
ncbi:transcriptional regulator [Rhizobium sp. JAB6]|jgi:ArsR family transcriptional regulator|uniref:ArsR/SmtB family transcription factor n=1 Tax=Rhizobium sp. JAB6 TaxID=2127050 RepID=UPI000D129ADB|nr:metalloregulator ArsR/SmtB family transcription factor [Rhizobium sp. JAB6]PST19355.1 transcriptional regulator [Rhizobium sp. JAB6]